jgi:hypothetical protein
MEPLVDAGFRSIARSPPAGRGTAAVEFHGRHSPRAAAADDENVVTTGGAFGRNGFR